MDLDDVILHAILAAFDADGTDAAYSVADDADVPQSTVDEVLKIYR